MRPPPCPGARKPSCLLTMRRILLPCGHGCSPTWGYRVLPATSPEQALSYFNSGQEQIDLVITDHTMPRMTGLQLATEIMTNFPNIPIILCSGYSEAVTLEEALDAGVRRFLAKPVDMRLLAIAIREILPNRNGGNL